MELQHCAGTQFDPAIVQAFIEALGRRAQPRARTLRRSPSSFEPWRRTTSSRSCPTGETRHSSGQPPASRCPGCWTCPTATSIAWTRTGSPVCVASVREGEWYPDYRRKRGGRQTVGDRPGGDPHAKTGPHRLAQRFATQRRGARRDAPLERRGQGGPAADRQGRGHRAGGDRRDPRGSHDDARPDSHGRVDLPAHRPGRPRRRSHRSPEAPCAPAGVAAGVEPRDRHRQEHRGGPGDRRRAGRSSSSI